MISVVQVGVKWTCFVTTRDDEDGVDADISVVAGDFTTSAAAGNETRC